MLSLPGSWVWDFWVAEDDDRFHLFYLHAPHGLGDPELRHRNARIGHAVSTDLRDWEVLGEAFPPGALEDFDATATWTGSVVRGPEGLWRMFYTGSRFLAPPPEVRNVETVGVATSWDLLGWAKQPGAVVTADGRWYELLGTSGWREEAWRDPWVFRDPGGDGWHMLVTARAKDAALDDAGVVGHAWSGDLDTWQVRPPLSAPGAGFGHLEVLQVARVEGRDFLLFSCDTTNLSARYRAQGRSGGIWSLPVRGDETGSGPGYDIAASTLLSDEALYSGRVVRDPSGAAVLLAFRGSGGGGDDRCAAEGAGGFRGVITDPLPLAVDDDGQLVLAGGP